MFDSRNKRAAAQGMIGFPLHPDPDGLTFSSIDRKMVVGVYPIEILASTTGASASSRGRHGDYSGNAPRLFGDFVPLLDKSEREVHEM